MCVCAWEVRVCVDMCVCWTYVCVCVCVSVFWTCMCVLDVHVRVGRACVCVCVGVQFNPNYKSYVLHTDGGPSENVKRKKFRGKKQRKPAFTVRMGAGCTVHTHTHARTHHNVVPP